MNKILRTNISRRSSWRETKRFSRKGRVPCTVRETVNINAIIQNLLTLHSFFSSQKLINILNMQKFEEKIQVNELNNTTAQRNDASYNNNNNNACVFLLRRLHPSEGNESPTLCDRRSHSQCTVRGIDGG